MWRQDALAGVGGAAREPAPQRRGQRLAGAHPPRAGQQRAAAAAPGALLAAESQVGEGWQ